MRHDLCKCLFGATHVVLELGQLSIDCRWCICRTPGIDVHLMGMATPHEVETDLQVVREALGLVPCATADLEMEVYKGVQQILEPAMNLTWKTGRDNNRTP